MKHGKECGPELCSDQGEQEEVGGRVENYEEVVQGNGDDHPERGAKCQTHLGAGTDLG